MANAPTKPTTTVKKEGSGSSLFATLTVPICIAVAICIFIFILGDSSHFKGGDNTGDPADGDLFGTMYKGGKLVPIGISYFLMLIVLSI
jgi:biopolymer transport protein ExbB